jgi:hypothetical protein
MALVRPMSQVVCASWPQACMTGTSSGRPSCDFRVTPHLARIGQARNLFDRVAVHVSPEHDNGARTILQNADQPVLPMPNRTLNPFAFSSRSMIAAVRVSMKPSSGLAWMSLKISTRRAASLSIAA